MQVLRPYIKRGVFFCGSGKAFPCVGRFYPPYPPYPPKIGLNTLKLLSSVFWFVKIYPPKSKSYPPYPPKFRKKKTISSDEASYDTTY